MSMIDPLLIAVLALPITGLLAGYLASRLAIRLLFTPRKPWQLFKLRLPLTPGAFAAGRRQLAANLGNVIGGRLLHREAIGRAVREPRFQEQLKRSLGRRLDTLLDRDLGPAATLVPDRFRSYYEMGGKVLRGRLLTLVHGHLDNPAFATILRERLGDAGCTDETIHLLRSPQFKRLLDGLLTEVLEEKILSQPIGPLADLLPEEVQDGICDALVQQASDLLTQQVPELAEALQIRAMIAQRVDDADPGAFQAMLLPVVTPRLQAIALLGGLLGLLIGLASLPLLGVF